MPNSAVDNNTMESVLGQVGDRPSRARKLILRSNKITSRYYAIDPATRATTHTNAQLTAKAVEKLQNEVDFDQVDVLVCGTTIPDQIMPNHAVMVHGELALPPLEVISTSGICLSGMTSLKYAYTAIKSGEAHHVISTGSENVSARMRSENFTAEIESKVEQLEQKPEIAFEKDFLRWMLSDGAGAMALSDKPNDVGLSIKINNIFIRSYAGTMETCMYAGCEKMADGSVKSWGEYDQDALMAESILSIKQDVKLLNKSVTEYTVYAALKEMLEKKIFKPEDIDWFLPHYSSDYFRNEVYSKMCKAGCDIPQDKWFTNLSTKGNTGSASMYIILEEYFNTGMAKKGEKLLCYIPESGRFSTAFLLLEVV